MKQRVASRRFASQWLLLWALLGAAITAQPTTQPAIYEAILQNYRDGFSADLGLANYRVNYRQAYNVAEAMQQLSNAADADFMRRFPSSPDPGLLEDNVRIHSVMALVAARLGYEDLYQRHLDVALSRIRRASAYRGWVAEEALRVILDGQYIAAGRPLLGEFCQWASSAICDGASPSIFEDYRAAATNPVEFIFNRSSNLWDLKEFSVSILRPGEASPHALLFANALTNQLRQPLVGNWFIQDHLNKLVQPRGLSVREPDKPELFARQSRINIDAGDYFVVDEADLEKQEWLTAVRTQHNLQQIISMFLRIPDGEYYVHRTDPNDQLPADAKPNLIVDREAGIEAAIYELIMNEAGDTVTVRSRGALEPAWTWADLLRPDFKVLRFDVGFNSASDIDGGAEFRLFHQFNKNFGFQTQFELAYRSHEDTADLESLLPTFVQRDNRPLEVFRSREFQLDFGPVFRINNVQVAIMESLRWVNRSQWDQTGLVGQYFFNVGYIFEWGQVGGFITRANRDEAIVRRVPFDNVFIEETFLKVTDQIGVNFNVNAFKDISVEGAFGYLSTARRDDVPGGVVRVNLPPRWGMRMSAEFGYNESFLSPEDSWRFGFGLRFGEWGPNNSPREFRAEDKPVPVYVPRVRYETLTRVVREGNRPPVAILGPDMEDVPPFTRVVVDGSESFDPDEDPITFEWTKLDDCPREIILENADGTGPVTSQTQVVSFVIGPAQMCTIQLVVTDSFGASSEPATKKTTSLEDAVPEVVLFIANPADIRRGQKTTLTWETVSAATVMITNSSGFTDIVDENGNPVTDGLPLSGSAMDMPQETTTYVLTACNAANVCSIAEVTVLVRPPLPVITKFTATPPEVRIGEDPNCLPTQGGSLLEWMTENATTVTLTNLDGTPEGVPPNASRRVCISQTTTFTLTATNDRGEIVTADVTVTVSPDFPEIVFFRATPPMIFVGEKSTLAWETRGVESVTITNVPGFPTLAPTGSVEVMPDVSTTYTLTATNDSGETVSAEITLVVKTPLPEITRFVAEPPEIRQGDPSTLIWETQGAVSVTISNLPGFPTLPPNGSVVVMPSETTTYQLTAVNVDGDSVMAEVTVLVRPPQPEILEFIADPTATNQGVPGPADCTGEDEAGTLLTWRTLNAVTTTLTNSSDDIPQPVPANSPPAGFPLCLTRTTTFTLTVTNNAAEVVSASVTVTVGPPLPPPPVIELFEVPGFVIVPGMATIEWRTLNADSVRIEKITGPADNPTVEILPASDPQGTLNVPITERTIIRLTAFGGAGQTDSQEKTILAQ